MRSSTLQAASTFSCWGLDATAISVSTSPATISRRRLTAYLTASTSDANKRFFEKEEDVPRQAYTMGIQTIMQAKKVLLVASGADKADALAKTIEGPVTPEVPASILQFHPDVTIVADEAALSLVKGNID